MTPEQRAQAFEDFKAHTMKPLSFPLIGKPNRPIYDADGRLVSISEYAPLFVACVNLVHELATHTAFNVTDEFRAYRESAKQIMEQKP